MRVRDSMSVPRDTQKCEARLSSRFRLRAYRTVQTRVVSSRSVHHGIFPDVYFYTHSLQRPHERRPMASRREQVSALFFVAWAQRRLTECFPWATEGPNPPTETLTFKKEFFWQTTSGSLPAGLNRLIGRIVAALVFWAHQVQSHTSIWEQSQAFSGPFSPRNAGQKFLWNDVKMFRIVVRSECWLMLLIIWAGPWEKGKCHLFKTDFFSYSGSTYREQLGKENRMKKFQCPAELQFKYIANRANWIDGPTSNRHISKLAMCDITPFFSWASSFIEKEQNEIKGEGEKYMRRCFFRHIHQLETWDDSADAVSKNFIL